MKCPCLSRAVALLLLVKSASCTVLRTLSDAYIIENITPNSYVSLGVMPNHHSQITISFEDVDLPFSDCNEMSLTVQKDGFSMSVNAFKTLATLCNEEDIADFITTNREGFFVLFRTYNTTKTGSLTVRFQTDQGLVNVHQRIYDNYKGQ